MFANATAGEYKLTLSTRATTKTATIILYPAEDENRLNSKLLIDEAAKRINLLGANYNANGIPYFAKQIVVRSGAKLDTYYTDDGGKNYYTNTPVEDRIALSWAEGDNVTYKITLTDVFGRTDTTNFNTISGFDGFYSVFSEVGNVFYNEEKDIYYAYQNVVSYFKLTFWYA